MENAKVSEVMTEGVIAVEKHRTVREAANILRDEGIRGLVVVEEGEAIGIVVCRDIVYQLTTLSKEPSEVKVNEIMSEDLIVAEENESLDDVAMAMIQNNVSRIPVVRQDLLVGIVTQSDIIRAWPGFAEIIGEEKKPENPAGEPIPSYEGECEECGNYSENLKPDEGQLLCSECRAHRR